MIFNLVLLYNSGPLQLIVFHMMNLWCWWRLIKKLRQDTWTSLHDEAQAAVILLDGFDTLQWCLSILFRLRPPAAATLYIWMHALCFAPHLDSLSLALIGFLFHITSRFKFGRGFKTFKCNRLCFLIYLFGLPRLNQWEAVRVMKHL